MKKSDPTAEALRTLADARDLPEVERRTLLKKHLANRSNWVVAKAAQIAGEVRDDALAPDLVAAFHRLLVDAKLDKGCTALTEIAAALYALDHHDPDVWLAGIKHVQMEGSFGPPVDVAVQLRSHAAMGLAQTLHPEAPCELVKLLADHEPRARAGAARAFGCLPGESAKLLLRFKILTGDPSSEVMAECFASLLTVDPEGSVDFVGKCADTDSEEIAEAAILAIGGARTQQAVEWLIRRWENAVFGPMRQTLLLALATARLDTAIAFLLKLLDTENPRTAVEVMSALRIYKHDERVRREVGEIVDRRRERTLVEAFRAEF